MARTSTLAALAWTALVGCHSDISCPGGREARGETCICPANTIEVGGECVKLVVVDAGGAVEVADAGGDDENDPAPIPTGTTGTAAGAGTPARPPDASTAPPEPASGPAAPVAPVAPTAAERCLATCAKGNRCNSAGECVTVSSKCNGILEAGEVCDDGNDDPYDDCVSCEPARCGDGFIQPDAPRPEDCEYNAIGPGLTSDDQMRVSVWNADNCNFETCQRTIYKLCQRDSECPPGGPGCLGGMCVPASCDPTAPGCMLPPCPELPGYVSHRVGSWCFIRCRNKGPVCPSGMRCEPRPFVENQPALCVNASLNPVSTD